MVLLVHRFNKSIKCNTFVAYSQEQSSTYFTVCNTPLTVHSVTCSAPTPGVVVPDGQGLQAVCAVMSWYVPSGHKTSFSPSVEYVPSGVSTTK